MAFLKPFIQLVKKRRISHLDPALSEKFDFDIRRKRYS
jgi:hypothetical protein